jgi:UDP-N-acetyl-2-amino-2-deoxyglucuronate dehydrogenase
MTDERIRVGVIGLGVGERHLVGFRQVPGVDVKAICDIDADKLTDVGDRRRGAERHSDYRAITEDPDIDVVSVCSYDDAHAEQCISAFHNGKHVMVEKPVALSRDDAAAVLRAQQDSGCLITSNLVLRASPRFKELREQIASGQFGDIVCIEGDYLHEILWKITRGWRGRMDFYCTVFGGGIHLIDLMRWLVGQEVVEVCGMGNKIFTRDSDYRFDDTFVNLLRFDGGTIGKSMSTFGPRRTKFHSLNVYGTKKTFVNDIPNARIFDGDQPENEHPVTTPYPGMEKGDLIPEFIAAVRQGREPNIGAKDVFRVMDICFSAWESVQSGRTVKVSYSI